MADHGSDRLYAIVEAAMDAVPNLGVEAYPPTIGELTEELESRGVLILRDLWDRFHLFDDEAWETGRCALGSFKEGCGHKVTFIGLVNFIGLDR